MSEEIKYIFECLNKYANLTPDAIDDLYYLEGYIEDLQQKVDRLNNILDGLEKYIKAEIPEEEFVNSEWYVNILDKLKALKENNK